MSAYASNARVEATAVQDLIGSVFAKLSELAVGQDAVPETLTPEDYRAKWGLRSDYPMVAPSYAAKRQEIARTIGLGRRGRVKPAVEAEPVPDAAPVPTKRRSRSKAAA